MSLISGDTDIIPERAKRSEAFPEDRATRFSAYFAEDMLVS